MADLPGRSRYMVGVGASGFDPIHPQPFLFAWWPLTTATATLL